MFALRLLGNQNKIMFKLNYNAVKIENFACYFIYGRNGKMYNFPRNNYTVEFISCIYIFVQHTGSWCIAGSWMMTCYFIAKHNYDTH